MVRALLRPVRAFLERFDRPLSLRPAHLPRQAGDRARDRRRARRHHRARTGEDPDRLRSRAGQILSRRRRAAARRCKSRTDRWGGRADERDHARGTRCRQRRRLPRRFGERLRQPAQHGSGVRGARSVRGTRRHIALRRGDRREPDHEVLRDPGRLRRRLPAAARARARQHRRVQALHRGAGRDHAAGARRHHRRGARGGGGTARADRRDDQLRDRRTADRSGTRS